MTAMKNVTDLRNELSQVFMNLKNKKEEITTAKAMVATSNSILKSVEMELKYNKMTDSKKKIGFLE